MGSNGRLVRPGKVPANEAFVITVGVPSGEEKTMHCNRVLKVLEQAGYSAGPTSDESIKILASQIEDRED